MSFIRRRSSIAHFRAIALVGAASAATSIAAGVAHADGRLAARYTMSVGGVPVGKSDLKVAIGSIEYAVSVSGHASGMLRALVSGEGSLTTRGAIVDGHLVPTTFSSSTSEADHKAEVTMTLDGGIVKDLSTETGSSAADRVALTAEHRKGVIDPMTALLVTVDGAGDVIGPDACQRTLPIFDGRRRYDLKLSFRRIDSVQTERGYRGQAVVCGVTFQAIAGHRASSPLVKYLADGRDIELALAPIAGTRVLAPFRLSVTSMLGNMVIEAAEFETTLTISIRAALPTNVMVQ